VTRKNECHVVLNHSGLNLIQYTEGQMQRYGADTTYSFFINGLENVKG